MVLSYYDGEDDRNNNVDYGRHIVLISIQLLFNAINVCVFLSVTFGDKPVWTQIKDICIKYISDMAVCPVGDIK